MKRIPIIALIVASLFACTGCTSLWSLQCSKDEILRNRIMASGNAAGMRALQLGAGEDAAIRAVALDNGAGIGVDVGNLQALTQHPIRQLGAALLDAGMTYGAYLGGKALLDANNNSEPSQTSGRDIIQVNVDGQNNTVNVGDETTTTTTTSPTPPGP